MHDRVHHGLILADDVDGRLLKGGLKRLPGRLAPDDSSVGGR